METLNGPDRGGCTQWSARKESYRNLRTGRKSGRQSGIGSWTARGRSTFRFSSYGTQGPHVKSEVAHARQEQFGFEWRNARRHQEWWLAGVRAGRPHGKELPEFLAVSYRLLVYELLLTRRGFGLIQTFAAHVQKVRRTRSKVREINNKRSKQKNRENKLIAG